MKFKNKINLSIFCFVNFLENIMLIVLEVKYGDFFKDG